MSQYILIAIVGLGCVCCALHVVRQVLLVARQRRVCRAPGAATVSVG